MPDISAPSGRRALALPDAQPITARRAAAGSLRREVEALLDAAPDHPTLSRYRELVVRENVAGKTTASSRAKVWQNLKLRYVLDPRVHEFRAFAGAMRGATAASDRGLICLLMFARTDRLFRDVTLACISPHLGRRGTTNNPSALDE